MPAQFDDGGIRFRYPEDWQLERQDSEDGWTVSLQSPETAFLMLCVREDAPPPTKWPRPPWRLSAMSTPISNATVASILWLARPP